MSDQLAFEFAAKTDPGMMRSHNEDCLSLSPALPHGFGLAILADGMGGHNAGEVASAMAILVLRTSLEAQLERLPTTSLSATVNANVNAIANATATATASPDQSLSIQQMVIDAVKLANRTIFDAAGVELDYSGMGTTLVLALFHQERVLIAHVGDSRAYRFRHGRLERMTRDHSMLQEHIDAGLISLEDAKFSQNKNIITRALGVDPDVEVEMHEEVAEPEDLYLLCSDGLSDMLDDEEIEAIVAHYGSNLEPACDALVDAANVSGGRDNISVILIKANTVQSQEQATGPFGRILRWFK